MSSSEYDASDDDEQSDDDWESLKCILFCKIKGVHSTGSFATSGRVQDFENPGVSIDSQELIRLPLSVDDAHALVQASHRSPFGKGTETIIDESVRKTWQIDANQIHFHNKRWQDCLERIMDTVAKDLGVAGRSKGLRADLHKMLLYEEGAMFKMHRDTEKVPGMFGTLVVCLPSLHTGGDIQLQHGGKTIRYATSDCSAFDAQYIAWYADVCHEIEPVQSGYRWVLTYNLINDADDSDLSAQYLEARVNDLTQTLDTWISSPRSSDFLIYLLDHQYTNESLQFPRLKGADLARVTHIAQSCTKHGMFQVLLASMELRITDLQCEDDENESALYLTRIVHLDGSDLTVHSNLYIQRETLLGWEHYSDRNPDVQYGGGYLGNQHAEIDQFYKDTVVIIVPTKLCADFLLGSNPRHDAVQKLMDKLLSRANNKNDSNSKAILLQMCRDVLDDKSRRSLGEKDHFLGPVATSVASLSQPALFAEAVEQTFCSFDPPSFARLGQIINLRDCSISTNDITTALTKNGKLKQTISNINSFRKGFVHGNPLRHDTIEAEFTQIWLDSATINSLKAIEKVSVDDACCPVEIIVELKDSRLLRPSLVYQAVCIFAARFAANVEFSIPCTLETLSHVRKSALSPRYITGLFNQLLEPMVSHFNLQVFASYTSRAQAAIDIRRSIASLYTHINEYNSDLSSVLLARIQEQADNLAQPLYETFLPDFLSDLLAVVDDSSTQAQECLTTLLETYVIKFVGYEPTQPVDWSRPDEVHQCLQEYHICARLNEFLRDPDTKSHEVASTNIGHTRYYFSYLDFVQDTLNPEFVVEKTLRYWSERCREWQKRVELATERIELLPVEKLKGCLLDRYEGVVSLECVKIPQHQHLHRYSTESNVPRKRPLSEST